MSNSSDEEVRDVVQRLNQTKEFELLSQIVSAEIQSQLGETLAEFEQAIADKNVAALQLMSEALTEAKEESESIQGAMKRLHQAVAPSIPRDSELLTFNGALSNWQKYGSLFPTQADIDAANTRKMRWTAWDLFWQMVAAIAVKKIDRVINKSRN